MANFLGPYGLDIDSGKSVQVGYSEDNAGVRIYGDYSGTEEYGLITVYGKGTDSSYNYNRRYITIGTAEHAEIKLHGGGKYENFISLKARVNGEQEPEMVMQGGTAGNPQKIQISPYSINFYSGSTSKSYINQDSMRAQYVYGTKVYAGASNSSTQGYVCWYKPSSSAGWRSYTDSSGVLNFVYVSSSL